ncbi:MAG: hypothetical protein R3F43_06470 [bacterium]
MIRRLLALSLAAPFCLAACDDAGGGGDPFPDAEVGGRMVRDASVVGPGGGGAGGGRMARAGWAAPAAPVAQAAPAAWAAWAAASGALAVAQGAPVAAAYSPAGCEDGSTRPCQGECGVQRCVLGSWGPARARSRPSAATTPTTTAMAWWMRPSRLLGVGCQVTQGPASPRASRSATPPATGGVPGAAGAGRGRRSATAWTTTATTRSTRTSPAGSAAPRTCTARRATSASTASVRAVAPVPARAGGSRVRQPRGFAGFGRYAGDNSQGANETFGDCGGLLGPEAIFTFQVAMDQAVHFDTDGSLADTVLSITTVCGDPFSEQACDDDGGSGLASSLGSTPGRACATTWWWTPPWCRGRSS